MDSGHAKEKELKFLNADSLDSIPEQPAIRVTTYVCTSDVHLE